MKIIQHAKIEEIPFHHIVFAVTSKEDCCDMSRIVFLENYPKYGDYTFAEGGHCSCYGFESIQWTLTILENRGELKRLITSWIENKGDYIEAKIAKMILDSYYWSREDI